MSESEKKDNPPKAFSAFAYESKNDPDTLSLSDSDPDLSDEAEVTSLSPAEEEDEEEETRPEEEQKSFTLPFTLKGTNAGFSLRSNDIFGGLLDLQKKSPLTQQNRKREVSDTLPDDVKAERSDVSAEQVSTGSDAAPIKSASKGSTSAKPSGPSGRLPDYLTNPERWTKYSLENVPDTSDRTNRSTALNFLAELKHQKEATGVPKEASKRSYNQDSSSSGEGRILFSKPTKKGQQSSDKAGLQSGPLDMSGVLTEEVTDQSEVPGEQAEVETLGFHGVRKRGRKNIRPKSLNEDEEEAS